MVFIFAIRGAPPQIFNAAKNYLLCEYHIVINCDVALRKSKVTGTLGIAMQLVLIAHPCCPSKTIKVYLHYITLQQ